MSDQFSSANNGSVTVFIYEREFDFLKWLVLQKREIETGGDLFGLWQDERTAVVQLILGPGKGCRRTTTSFHQDVTYLGEVGGFLASSQGLCNIGEWHSHHTLGLAEPSYGDQQTVWNNISPMAGGRFLVFIANIRGTPPMVNIGCFLFNMNQQEILRGNIKCLPCPSPVRMTVDNTYITSKAERTQDWTTFMKCQASMQRNNKPVVDRSTPRDGKYSTQKSKQNRTAKARNGSANTGNGIRSANAGNRDPSMTIGVSNSPKGGDGILSTSSNRNGSLGSENDDLNARNGEADTRDRGTITNVESTAPRNGNGISNFPSTQNGNANARSTNNGHPSTSNTESHTSKDGNGISNIPSRHNLNPGANMKNSKPSKKGNQVNKRNTTSKTRKSRSNKKSKTARKRKKCHEQEEMNENDYGDEDPLLSVEESEEQELSKCGKICNRLREFFTTVRNFLGQKICGCC